MAGFKDPTLSGRVAMAALCLYMVLEGLAAILWFRSSVPEQDPFYAIAAIGSFVALIACYILVGMWIYRTNANAHGFGSGMSITPGWAIGWFFIPFANLVMPYRGVKETWNESHQFAGRFEDVDSPLLGWWWGLWIAAGILSTTSVLVGGDASDALVSAAYADLSAAAASFAASLILIRLIRRLDSAQLAASRGSVFA
jgi:hypothetical protein